MVFLAGALVLLVLPLLLLPCAIFAPGFPIAVACCRRSVFITCGSFRLVLVSTYFIHRCQFFATTTAMIGVSCGFSELHI